MILLNFSHPLLPDHMRQIKELAGRKVERVIEVHSQIDAQQPLAPQEWQSLPILVNPPSLNYSAALLMAELHGRMGYFPTCLRPVKDALPPASRWRIMNLQAARQRR